LEYDLVRGERGKRSVHAELLLTRLTGTEAALVVNNNAAAVLLVLTALARRKRVIISRTQLVEIGGGFRVPEVMEQSGAKLVSIGTTNRVHLRDYQEALLAPAGLVMCAHHSNFRIIGFTSEPEIKDVVRLAHQAGIPLVHDLGSGALLDTARYGVAHEPTVQESLQAGVDIVCISGDKLLGGPQAGIIIGKTVFLDKIKSHPLARALRADKVCLAGLSATLLHYLKGEAEKEIPVWRMLSIPLPELKKKVKSWMKAWALEKRSKPAPRLLIGIGVTAKQGMSTKNGPAVAEWASRWVFIGPASEPALMGAAQTSMSRRMDRFSFIRA